MSKPLIDRVESIIKHSTLTDNEKYDLAVFLEYYMGAIQTNEDYKKRIKRVRESLNYLVNKKETIEKSDLWYLQDVVNGRASGSLES